MSHDRISGQRLCPLCEGARRVLVFRRDEWEVVECEDCSMVFLANEVSYEMQVQEHDFAESHQREHERRVRKHPVLAIWSWLMRRLKPHMGDRLLRQTLRWRQAGKLVDFGCGDGTFLERAARRFEVTGIEISSKLAAMARGLVPVATILETPVSSAALPAETFHVVTQFSVLEHEWQPLAALRVAYTALKPGGVTIIKVPNYASWNRRIMGAEWCGIRLPNHCNYFTPETLSAMLHKAGFRPLRGSFLDRLPTSDSLWMAAEKPSA